MNVYKHQLKNLLKQLLFIFIVYTLCRLLFYFFNRTNFQDLTITELLKLLFFGLRFDTFSIASTNALYILMCALPFRFYHHKTYQKVTTCVFILTNSIAILLNFVDFAYFPFNMKRMPFDAFFMVFSGQSDFIKLLPHFLVQYWYLVIIYILFVFIIIRTQLKIKQSEEIVYTVFTIKKGVFYFFIFLSITGLTVLGIRGGTQKVPIVLVDAAAYTSPNFIPIIINTPFSILKSSDLTSIEPLKLLSEEEQNKYFNPIHNGDTDTFNKLNVCVILLESFSKEFTSLGNRKSYTPFLDSLMSQSITFTNAYANGKTSINSIPSVIASMPCFLDNQYLNSIYSNNTLQTLPSLLKEKGYNSIFFHGGTNGTINLNSFAKLAGYDKYYGRTEYNDDSEYDGQWGIWDEPFLKRTVYEMGALKTPFFTTIFTLSSHNPYKVPIQYKGKFPKGKYEIIESIGYADYALKQFFNLASKQPWFNNTLFVITADHTSVSEDPFYSNLVGQYSIPILIYKKGIAPEKSNKTVQQIDILPTILDYMNFDKPYYSFGESMFSEKKQMSLYYVGPEFHCIKDSFMFTISNYKLIEKFNFKRDSLLTVNLIDTISDKEILKKCNAFIQRYHNDVIGNKTYYKVSKTTGDK